MRRVFRTFILCFILSTIASPWTEADPSPTGTPVSDANGILQFNTRPGAAQQTERLLDQQNRNLESGSKSTITLMSNFASGQARAQEIMNTLQNEELKKALEKVTQKGKEKLASDPDLKNPAAIVGGALALWMGKTMQIIKDGNFKLSSRVEGRNRSSEFMMESPILNGKLQFNPSDGLSIQMNRSISSVNSKAEFMYNTRSQAITTQLRHPLAPHIDFTFGASQNPQNSNTLDGRAGVEYRLSF